MAAQCWSESARSFPITAIVEKLGGGVLLRPGFDLSARTRVLRVLCAASA
jgi:hypothetical protein